VSVYVFLAIVTVFYAGYNLLIKVSGGHVPATATTTVLATLSLQAAALGVSLVFAAVLLIRGGHALALPGPALAWAAAAGVCIGIAEIAYFYVFGGLGGRAVLPANVVVPTVVCGTVVITTLVAAVVFHEALGPRQIAGCLLVAAGIAVLFWPKT
jgi:drug/metabolite transporter (DMT)-like permease